MNFIQQSLSHYFYPVILIIVVLVVFFPILQNDFLYAWDDQWMVMNQYTEGGVNIRNLWAIFTEFYNGQYGPINEYIFLLLYTMFGYVPLPFHFVSMILHLSSVCFVYYIILQLFAQTTRTNFIIKNVEAVAFLTALIFAIHPLNVESVAWISAVKVLTYAFFYLAASYTYLMYLKKMQLRYYIFTFILFFFSFLGKEQAVTFPVWLVLMYWILGFNLKSKTIWLCILPFILLALFFGYITLLSQAQGGEELVDKVAYPFWQRILLGSYSFVEYICKFIFPYRLLYIYPFPMSIGEPTPSWLLVYPSLLIIIVVTLWKHLINKPFIFGLLFFIIHIVITLHIISLSRSAVIADRYIYISSIGSSFIVAYYFIRMYEQCLKCKRIYLSTLFCCCILYMGIYSMIRCQAWRTSDTIKKEFIDLIKYQKG